MKFTFLFLALGLLVFPLIFHIDKKIFGHGNFTPALGATLISAIVFCTIAIVLHVLGILIYDESNTLQIIIKDVPLEQYVLNFTFSFAIISLYQYLNIKYPDNNLQRYSLALSNLLLGLCVAFLFFAYNKWYTLSAVATLFVLLFLIEYVGKLRFMYRAYRTFMVMLIPFYLVYGMLFWNGILKISENGASKMYIAKIPVENHFMMLSMLLMSIYMFEFFKSKRIA